ncbi:MAG: bifunctional phosphoribosylaminoimidazolecarboxamide formyltransferase/IMP cyclohydrolase, partial [Candidatus Thermoplasmatota archaeon]|nr:bifunctional phosphoribosylaminoimidazolecarboxamide formyltransferase/IMP cyclohydrolase [Candidatus Thermoplasmatota archaeon]MEE3081555.1 bifunctional phosphoribosylaminoimidazolecarboxamide formyltransferase/IMP cyclohydrolase [Candidatus Thermoplasmatota archaeon]
MEHKENLSRRKISRVLISVSDKSGIVDLSKGLSENGIEIVSTGGTSKAISEAGIPVRPV